MGRPCWMTWPFLESKKWHLLFKGILWWLNWTDLILIAKVNVQAMLQKNQFALEKQPDQFLNFDVSFYSMFLK